LVHSIKFAIFSLAFASIITKVVKLTAIVAKNGLVIRDIAEDIVAKILCYCSKTDLAGDITGKLTGAKKNCAIVAKLDFGSDIVATIFCYCWSCHTLQLPFLLSLSRTHRGKLYTQAYTK
jgi:hypothetical protein